MFENLDIGGLRKDLQGTMLELRSLLTKKTQIDIAKFQFVDMFKLKSFLYDRFLIKP